jgi:hypothetical protein
MFRKTLLSLAAVATIGTAALAPTTASATYWHGYHGWHAKSFGYGCFKKRWVKTYYGWRLVRVNVCY